MFTLTEYVAPSRIELLPVWATVYINRGESVNIMSTLSGKRQFLWVVKSINRDRFQKKKEIKFFSYFADNSVSF